MSFIAKAGKPMAKVIPLGKTEIGTASRLSFVAGESIIPDDFDQIGSEKSLPCSKVK